MESILECSACKSLIFQLKKKNMCNISSPDFRYLAISCIHMFSETWNTVNVFVLNYHALEAYSITAVTSLTQKLPFTTRRRHVCSISIMSISHEVKIDALQIHSILSISLKIFCMNISVFSYFKMLSNNLSILDPKKIKRNLQRIHFLI